MPTVITRDQVKLYLGVSDTSIDAEIDRYIPIIDTAVKQITRNDWNARYSLQTTSGSRDARIFPIDSFDDDDINIRTNRNVGRRVSLSRVGDSLRTGQTVTADNVPSDTYFTDVFIQEYSGTGRSSRSFYEYNKIISVELSVAATATGSETAIVGINIAYLPIIAKGVNWFIAKENRTNPTSTFETKRVGPLTLTRSDVEADIDGRFGVPSWLVKALPKYTRGY